jgi:hypothetical protein
MTLSELSSFICGTVSQREATDLAACKGYLTQRHKMLWQDQLWKDSLVEYEQTITSLNYDASSSTWLPTRQILLLAPIVGQVVAMRTRDRSMGPQSSEYYYRRELDVFQNQGSAAEYRLLSPVVWDFDTAQNVSVVSTDSADAGSPARATTIADDGMTETARAIVLSQSGQSLGSVQTLEFFSKIATQSQVDFGISSAPVFAFTAENAYQFMSPPGILGIAVNSNQAIDISYNILQGARATINVNVGDVLYFFAPALVGSYTVLEGGALSVTDGFVVSFVPTPISMDTIVALSAADTAAQRRQRVQIIGGVADNTILRILGKRICPTFENDSDEPAITGCENALIAFAMADMYRRERQVGKAQATAQEGAALLAQLVKEQTSQQAFKKRFVPSDGFGGANAFTGPGGSHSIF